MKKAFVKINVQLITLSKSISIFLRSSVSTIPKISLLLIFQSLHNFIRQRTIFPNSQRQFTNLPIAIPQFLGMQTLLR